MSATTIVPSLIELDAEGIAWISGANTKVIEVSMDVMACGYGELMFSLPRTMKQLNNWVVKSSLA